MIGDDDYFKELNAQLDKQKRNNKVFLAVFVVLVTVYFGLKILVISYK